MAGYENRDLFDLRLANREPLEAVHRVDIWEFRCPSCPLNETGFLIKQWQNTRWQ